MQMEEVTIGDCRYSCIYALCEPGGVNPRYIGKTVQGLRKRQKQHLWEARSGSRLPVHRWIRKLYLNGKWLCIKLLEIVPSGGDWAAVECRWIDELKKSGVDLLNITAGGEGALGVVFSDERNKKISIKLKKGQTLTCHCGAQFWRKPSDIAAGEAKFCSRSCYQVWQKGKPKAIPKGGIPWNKGRPWSEVERKKISDGRRHVS